MWVVLATSLAATVWAFWPVLEFMVHTWNAVPEYSYGYYIPFISAFLVWHRSDKLREQALVGSFWGLALVALALALRWVGEASAIRLIGQYGFVVAVIGISVGLVGWRGTRLIAVPLGLLFFMIPLPQFVLREVSHGLQLVSSELGVALIRAWGISVFLEGNVIDLGSYKLQVVEACNGLRYLFPLFVLGIVAAYFFRGEWWKRALLVVSTIPLTIIVNSLRIGLIGVTVEYWGRTMAEGLVHDFEGWFMFIICQLLLMAEMALLARVGRHRESVSEVFAIDMPAPPARGAQRASHPLALASLASALLLGAASLASLDRSPRTQTVPERQSLALFPLRLDGVWEGRPDRLEPDVLATLAVDDYFIGNYQRSAGPWVNFYAAYYKSQSSGESTHSPRTCIPGGGWAILQIEPTEIALARRAPLTVNRAIIQKGDSRQLVYYWFNQRGRELTNEYAVKWYVLRDSIAMNRSDGALVRLVTPLVPGEDEAIADSRLAAFITSLEPRLAAFVPK
jgi:exosortase D (VPLPA-CTERM-specific)